MNWGYIFIVGLVFSTLLIFSQRVIPRRRRTMRIFIVVLGIILVLGTPLLGENILAFLIALIISFLFWLLIGRYNPPPEDDSIKVLGLDD
ncbi:hypothetical protein G4Y79_15040 [Phototrophicus methaneseepsis]|uniref:Uncharacterized protein n=1 Tax=Phototrophicus methaneseepsis TaxID=2710758 RepID=A0A7S8E5Z7_9CHLR|nr:hypothetical protein [Phototrophicus methaneseepsis]QPC81018.1 hypothetical protein G4Y79_15040 [Phototrophicus methaneseepsis]